MNQKLICVVETEKLRAEIERIENEMKAKHADSEFYCHPFIESAFNRLILAMSDHTITMWVDDISDSPSLTLDEALTGKVLDVLVKNSRESA